MESASPPSPKNDDTDVAVYLKLAATVLYYIVYPVYWLGYILFVLLQQILSPIWSVVSFVALPLTYLVAFVVHLLSLPFKLMAKLEVNTHPPESHVTDSRFNLMSSQSA